MAVGRRNLAGWRGRGCLSQEIDGVLDPLKFHARADYTVLDKEWKRGLRAKKVAPRLRSG